MILSEPKHRELFFNKQVDQASIGELTKSIIEIINDDKNLKKVANISGFEYTPKPINIHIDSYGGNVYQILGLYSIIERSTTPIHTIVTGCAMSCGFVLLLSGHKRFAYPFSTILYHQISSGVWGKLKDIEDNVDETRRLQKILEDVTLKRTKISEDKLKEVFEKKIDWFIPSDEGLKLGIVDEIL